MRCAVASSLAALLVTVFPMDVAASLAGVTVATGDPGEPGAPEAKAPLVVFRKDHPVSEPKADKALLYVVRPTGSITSVKSFFFCDDEPLGINQGSSYFFAQVAPGKRAFWSSADNVSSSAGHLDTLELNVEAGQVYYLLQDVEPGTLPARARLELLDDAAGKEALAKCRRHGTLTDSGRARGRELARRRHNEMQEDLPHRAVDSGPGA